MSTGPVPGGIAIVLLAAGAGRRVGASTNKVLLPLDGIPLLAHCVRTALGVEGAHRIVVVLRPEDRAEVAASLAPHLGPPPAPGQAESSDSGQVDLWLVDGGAERHDSEARALEALRPEITSGEITVVAIHDSARPLATAALFRTVITTALDYGGAVPATAVDQLNRSDGSLAPTGLAAVQTPQAFRAGALLAAYDAASADGFIGTDTAACLERYTDLEIRAVEGDPANLKVTFTEDLALAAELITPVNG